MSQPFTRQAVRFLEPFSASPALRVLPRRRFNDGPPVALGERAARLASARPWWSHLKISHFCFAEGQKVCWHGECAQRARQVQHSLADAAVVKVIAKHMHPDWCGVFDVVKRLQVWRRRQDLRRVVQYDNHCFNGHRHDYSLYKKSQYRRRRGCYCAGPTAAHWLGSLHRDGAGCGI